jgi:mRNA-degrading endonuclease toxin of MazEF toxin-antitoxin module
MKRGEVWEVDFELHHVRTEIAKIRRGVIVQSENFPSPRSTVLVVPFTSNLKRANQFSPMIKQSETTAITVDVVALCHQMRAVDVALLLNRHGKLSDELMTRIDNALLETLGLARFKLDKASIIIPKRPGS